MELLLDNSYLKETIANNLISLNEKTEEYGIIITKELAYDLIETRNETLKNNNMIDFDNEVLERIICAFYDSSFISKFDYEETLNDLVDMYYDYRINYGYYMSDEIILKVMKYRFERTGTTGLLANEEEAIIKRNILQKRDWNYRLKKEDWSFMEG